ncbi:hypothetical protein J7382_14060 [Shimia sp. R11_0]|uniref:hypothetical protein n=1 Tax=Shimia sp. R11_0 TaxID=2821096 RepID=UPI001ADAF6F6|nr:hypothetical protein [Shimia sp. R11_0]MBO9478669.1 hypothetical protein [Shimia sp. R11_0]
MKNMLTYALCAVALSLTLSLPTAASAAECYADYKAKKDSPLRLHYGVVALQNGCDKASAQQEVAARIGQDGWTLLNVLSVFDSSQLAGKEASAGQFYLRY